MSFQNKRCGLRSEKEAFRRVRLTNCFTILEEKLKENAKLSVRQFDELCNISSYFKPSILENITWNLQIGDEINIIMNSDVDVEIKISELEKPSACRMKDEFSEQKIAQALSDIEKAKKDSKVELLEQASGERSCKKRPPLGDLPLPNRKKLQG